MKTKNMVAVKNLLTTEKEIVLLELESTLPIEERRLVRRIIDRKNPYAIFNEIEQLREEITISLAGYNIDDLLDMARIAEKGSNRFAQESNMDLSSEAGSKMIACNKLLNEIAETIAFSFISKCFNTKTVKTIDKDGHIFLNGKAISEIKDAVSKCSDRLILTINCELNTRLKSASMLKKFVINQIMTAIMEEANKTKETIRYKK